MKGCIIMHNIIIGDERYIGQPAFNYDAIEENQLVYVSYERTTELFDFIRTRQILLNSFGKNMEQTK